MGLYWTVGCWCVYKGKSNGQVVYLQSQWGCTGQCLRLGVKSNGQVVFEAHMVSPHQGVASPLKGRRGSIYEEQAFLLVSSYFYFYSKGMQ